MPRYDFECDAGHVTEQVASYSTDFIPCKCGLPAMRVSVYRNQYISCETGPKGGLKAEPPREEKSYRKEFKAFEEASQTMDYAYSRIDDPKVKAPNYYKKGVARAQAEMARTQGKYRID